MYSALRASVLALECRGFSDFVRYARTLPGPHESSLPHQAHRKRYVRIYEDSTYGVLALSGLRAAHGIRHRNVIVARK